MSVSVNFVTNILIFNRYKSHYTVRHLGGIKLCQGLLFQSRASNRLLYVLWRCC